MDLLVDAPSYPLELQACASPAVDLQQVRMACDSELAALQQAVAACDWGLPEQRRGWEDRVGPLEFAVAALHGPERQRAPREPQGIAAGEEHG
jgi:hypothetical protein